MCSELKPGDPVAYRTKDFIGYQWIMAEVQRVHKDGQVSIRTYPANVVLLIPVGTLTKIKTVWADTHKEVKG